MLGGAAVTEEIVPRLPVQRRLVRGLAAAARDHPRARPAPPRARDPAAGRHHSRRSTTTTCGVSTTTARTVRELRRWSLSDAEAYEEYGQLMVQMARFVKPILSIVAARPRQDRPARVDLRWARWRARSRTCRERLQGHVHPGDDDERRRLPRPVVRDRPAEGDDVGVRHHRHVPGRPLAGHRVRAAAPLHGRDRRRLPGVGHPPRRHRRRQPRHRLGGARRSAPRSAPRRRSPASTSRAAPSPASRWSRARSCRRRSCCRAPTAASPSSDLVEPGVLDDEFMAEVRRYRFRGSSGKVNLALDGLPEFTCLPGAGEHLRGAISFSPSVDVHGAGLRRRQVRPAFAAAPTST